MSILFSDHAKDQIERRGISEELITETVKDPDKVVPSYRGRKLRQKRIGSKILEVVTVTEGSRITIVTAYYL